MKYLTLLFLILTASLYGQKHENLAATPPMGWNSWNHFECNSVNEIVIKEIADAMVLTGMKDAGYIYVNIDDCWQIGRDSTGQIIVDSQKFPSGMKHLSDYIHSKGLKFGIYQKKSVLINP